MAEKLEQKYKDALEKRALGYDFEERVVVAGKNGKAEKVTITRRHVPPDPKAVEAIRRYKARGQW